MKITINRDAKKEQVEKEVKAVIAQAQERAGKGVTIFNYHVGEPTFGMSIIRKVEAETEGTVRCAERGNHSRYEGYITFIIG
jgi:hypothetical protein